MKCVQKRMPGVSQRKA